MSVPDTMGTTCELLKEEERLRGRVVQLIANVEPKEYTFVAQQISRIDFGEEHRRYGGNGGTAHDRYQHEASRY